MEIAPTEDKALRKLKKKLGKKEKKVDDLKGDIEAKQKIIVALETKIATLRGADAKSDKDKEKIVRLRQARDNSEKEVERITAENAKLVEENFDLNAKLQKLNPNDGPKGWAKPHKNHNHKRVPLDDPKEMAARLETQSTVGKDCKEIQCGQVILFLKDSRVLGYYGEAGSNIILPEDTELPDFLKAAALENARQLMVEWEKKHGNMACDERKGKIFQDTVTSLFYIMIGDHQGPTYINGHKPHFLASWSKDKAVTFEQMKQEQPFLLAQCMDYGFKHSKLDQLDKADQKKFTLKLLRNIKQNHTKSSRSCFGSDHGRVPRKMPIPQQLDPGRALVSANKQIAQLPPLWDGRVLEGPLIGHEKEKKERVKKEKRKRKVRRNMPNSTSEDSDDAEVRRLEEELKAKKALRKRKMKEQKDILDGKGCPTVPAEGDQEGPKNKKQKVMERRDKLHGKGCPTIIAEGGQGFEEEVAVIGEKNEDCRDENPEKLAAIQGMVNSGNKEILKQMLLDQM